MDKSEIDDEMIYKRQVIKATEPLKIILVSNQQDINNPNPTESSASMYQPIFDDRENFNIQKRRILFF